MSDFKTFLKEMFINEAKPALERYSGGSGGGSSKGLIEVTELPEVGEENVVYKLIHKNVGTEVPQNGYVEKVYFNTNLSVEETDAILETLDFSRYGNTYHIFVYDNGSAGGYPSLIVISATIASQGTVKGYGIGILNSDNTQVEVIYTSNETCLSLLSQAGITITNNPKVGWNMSEMTVGYRVFDSGDGATHNNYKISNVVSVTPFEEKIPSEMYYLYKENEWVQISGANIVSKGGTVVPNNGTISKVYFNTKLSIEEVVSLLEQLTYEKRGPTSLSWLVTNGDSFALTVVCVNGIYQLVDYTFSNTRYFISDNDPYGEVDFIGWNPDFNGVIEVNGSLASEYLGNNYGSENDKLINLISATPFENKVIKELSGDYEAVDIVVDELPSGSTQLENNLNVEKIYFNTKLTNEEVDAILDTLTLDSYLSYTINYQQVNGTTTSHTPLIITKAEAYVSGASGYAILQSTNALLYASNETVSNFVSSYLGISAKVGWNVSELETTNGTILDVGVDGDKLTQLFSATPFVEPNTIDLEQYLDNKQMPMSVTVNVESQEPNLQEKEITENGEYVADEGYDGFSKVTVNVKSSGSSENTLKKLLDGKKEASYLFRSFSGESVDDLISYSDTENVTKMDYMFNSCSVLKTIPQLDTSKVTSMSNMFNSCSVLKTIPQLDTSKVTNMSKMFYNCWNLTEIPQLDTSKVTDMNSMFFCASSSDGNKYLKTITLTDTSNVTHMNSMFDKCRALETISKLDMIKIKDVYYADSMFRECMSLTNLTLLNIKVNLQIGSGDGTGSFDWGHLLTLESLINTVKELINVGKARTLTMGSANLSKIASTYVKFTDSSVTSIPTNEKGDVVVCESTDTGAMLLSDYALLKNWTLA